MTRIRRLLAAVVFAGGLVGAGCGQPAATPLSPDDEKKLDEQLQKTRMQESPPPQ